MLLTETDSPEPAARIIKLPKIHGTGSTRTNMLPVTLSHILAVAPKYARLSDIRRFSFQSCYRRSDLHSIGESFRDE